MEYLAVTCSLALCFLTLSFVTCDLSRSDLQLISEFVERLLECKGVPGLSLSIVQDGQTQLAEGYGLSDMKTGSRVTSNTLFCIASLTKAFTAALLGKLLHRKGLTWDTRVSAILGQSYQFPDEFRTSRMTVRDLLLHRTGIPRYDILWLSDAYNQTEIFKRVRCMKEAGEFRTTTIYNNIMYSLAGHVAEVLGGKSWDELVRDELLRPLAMHETTFLGHLLNRPDSVWANVASKYTYSSFNNTLEIQKDDFRGARHISPAISMYTSASDMTKWLRVLLANGTGPGGEPLIDPRILSAMFEPQVMVTSDSYMYWTVLEKPYSPVTHMYDRYGLGWFTGNYEGYRTLMHYGSFIGHYSLLTILPSSNLGIYSAINGGRQSHSYTINTLLHTYIMELVTKGADRAWPTPEQACLFDSEFSNYTAPNPHSMKPVEVNTDYIGTYYHPVFGNVSIDTQEGDLTLKYGHWVFILLTDGVQNFYVESYNARWLMLLEGVYFNVGISDDDGGEIRNMAIPFLDPKDGAVFWKYNNDEVEYDTFTRRIDATCRRAVELTLCSSSCCGHTHWSFISLVLTLSYLLQYWLYTPVKEY